jgi:hypothetical protein
MQAQDERQAKSAYFADPAYPIRPSNLITMHPKCIEIGPGQVETL